MQNTVDELKPYKIKGISLLGWMTILGTLGVVLEVLLRYALT